MTRIKYKKNNDGFLIAGPFLKDADLVYLHISLVTLTYFINLGPHLEDKTIHTNIADTLASVKKKARKALKELGVVFYDEIRNRGEVEKY